MAVWLKVLRNPLTKKIAVAVALAVVTMIQKEVSRRR
jgi:hypothetical protein